MSKTVLYIIVALLLLTGCAGGENTPTDAAALPTVNLQPPTPPVNPIGSDLPRPPVATPTLAGEPQPAQADAAAPTKEAHLVPQPPPSATPEAAAEPAPADSARYTVAAAPGVPAELIDAARRTAATAPALFRWVDDAAADPPDLLISVNIGTPLASWVYAVAAPFATVTDATTFGAVRGGYDVGASELGTLLLDAETAATLTALWGAASPAAQPTPPLVESLWSARPAWTILPFHRLSPELKVIAVDDRSPLRADYAAEGDMLVVEFGLTGDGEAAAAFIDAWDGPTTNRDPNRLTRVAMTGVTALVRATAYQMEQRGVLYPGEEVAPVLQSADIAHISNEVAFAPDCPYPDPYGGTTFCSDDRYFELLKHLGTDLIELTGNHINDWGRGNLLRSLDMYEAAGMTWFGGGRNLADAQRAATFDHNGNRIAFVGCNYFGPPYSFAEEGLAGSRPCDPGLESQISQLKAEGYVVIATLQYTEYYQYPPTGQQQIDFIRLAAAGADAVSGSQAHHVQSFAFENGSFIHYGPGNLFFDQMDMMGTRQTFVDTYIVYDGRLLSVDLWTGLIENWARPRLMTPEERADMLQTVFQASGW